MIFYVKGQVKGLLKIKASDRKSKKFIIKVEELTGVQEYMLNSKSKGFLAQEKEQQS
jgi:hypothetical protein